MNIIESLQWRYATKQFDPTKKIDSRDLETIKEAVRLSASSYGLQPYKVLIVNDLTLIKKLKPASWGQSQITDASHILVFCHYNRISEKDIHDFIALKAKTQGLAPEDLKGYGDFMTGKLAEKTAEELKSWAARQAYIALGNLLLACATLEIDACPMEGFEPAQYDEILGLSEKGLSATVVAAIGYRSAADKTQYVPKVRKPLGLLFDEL